MPRLLTCVVVALLHLGLSPIAFAQKMAATMPAAVEADWDTAQAVDLLTLPESWVYSNPLASATKPAARLRGTVNLQTRHDNKTRVMANSIVMTGAPANQVAVSYEEIRANPLQNAPLEP